MHMHHAWVLWEKSEECVTLVDGLVCGYYEKKKRRVLWGVWTWMWELWVHEWYSKVSEVRVLCGLVGCMVRVPWESVWLWEKRSVWWVGYVN